MLTVDQSVQTVQYLHTFLYYNLKTFTSEREGVQLSLPKITIQWSMKTYNITYGITFLDLLY